MLSEEEVTTVETKMNDEDTAMGVEKFLVYHHREL